MTLKYSLPQLRHFIEGDPDIMALDRCRCMLSNDSNRPAVEAMIAADIRAEQAELRRRFPELCNPYSAPERTDTQ